MTDKAKATDAADDAAAKAAEAAAKEAYEAAKEAERIELKKSLGDMLEDLKTSDKDSAVATRLAWVGIGRKLIEGQSAFVKFGGNNVDDKAYGKWLESCGFTALGQRPTRAGAVWLAKVYDEKPGLYALFPTESKDGEPLKRSPRTLQAWVRDRVAEVFQSAHDADAAGVVNAAKDASKEEKQSVAITSMRNVYGALNEQLESAESVVEAKEKAMQKAKGADRIAAVMALASAEEALAYLQESKAILDQHTDEERLDLLMRWTPKTAAIPFKDATVEDAAERLWKMLKSHDAFSDVYAALGVLVDAHKAAVAADAGGVDSEPDDFDPLAVSDDASDPLADFTEEGDDSGDLTDDGDDPFADDEDAA